MDDVRVLCAHVRMRSVGTPVHGARGHTTAQNMLCAHTQQQMWQAALRSPCETTGLRRCLYVQAGLHKHGRGASQEADLTLPNLPQDPTPPMTSTLEPACDAAIV